MFTAVARRALPLWVKIAIPLAAVALIAGLGLALKSASAKLAGHAACLASVKGEKGAAPLAAACKPPIAKAVQRGRDYDRCIAVVKDIAGGAAAQKICAPEIAHVDAVADRAESCDAALGARPLNEYGLKASCSAGVKRLHGQVLADAATIDSLSSALADATRDRNAAVARAEARGRTQAERDSRAKAVRNATPADPSGVRFYGPDSLRERWSDAP